MTLRMALCMVLATGGIGQSAAAGPPPGGHEVFELWQEELQLSDQQLADIKELHFETQLEVIDKRSFVERAELEFARAMDADEPDETRVMNLFDALHKARMELERVHVQNRIRIKSILSETQELELRRLLKEHRAERRGSRPQRPPR